MATEFHRKTAALFEEFKKRELHFLNTEVNLNGNMNWKNNINSPLQEYMQKIQKREQETEKTYKNLMRQMEELGKCTDQMTVKLEKLNALRHVAVSSNTSAWPSTDDTYDKPFQPYYSNTLLQTTPKILSSDAIVSHFPLRIQPDISLSNPSFQLQSTELNYHSITTQTEYIFCDNCHFPLILNSDSSVSNTNLFSSTSHKTVTIENEQDLHHEPMPSETRENVDFSRGFVAEKDNTVPRSDYNFSHPQANDRRDSMFINERISSGPEEISLKEQEFMNEQIKRRMSKSSTDNEVIDESTNKPFPKRMSESDPENSVPEGLSKTLAQKRISKSYIDDVVKDGTEVPFQTRMSESYIDNAVTGDYITHTEEKQYVELQDNDLLSNDGNFEQIISKSDDESMSHEFNFLDSDKSKIPRKQPFNQISGEVNSQLSDNETPNERPENTQLEASYSMQSNSSHLLKIQQISGSGETIGANSKDLSYSPGPPSTYAHSENTSVVSESDSFSEKETPLTATAAYQALLGNVSAAKPKQKNVPVADSDSEDEIENALADAVRRSSHIAFDAAVLDPKAERRKESIAEVKTERNTKPVDSVSSNKPQNKLSKNTRKVLGLDTSSGSEVELEVKSPTTKIDEESDEFDFYD